jgi:uncharacterized protein
MKIVWDEPKRQRNIENHGFDFADIVRFDWNNAVVKPSYASARGQARFAASGLLDDDLITVVFSPLGSEAISIISVRRASLRERRTYEEE